MRVLLDTQILIWSVLRSGRLSASRLHMIRDRSNQVFFSAASIWEIAIKRALRKPDFDLDPTHLAATAGLDFEEMPVTSRAAVRVADLSRHHRDPFDRLLVAQAIDGDAILLTADRALAAYGPIVVVVT